MKTSTAKLPDGHPGILIEDGASAQQIAENRRKYEE